MGKTLLILLSVGLASVLRADVTNVVAVAELGRIGTGTSADGWELTDVSNYSESYKYALKINKTSCRVVSPEYATAVVGVTLKTISSSQADRRLALIPIAEGVALTDPMFRCAYSPKNYSATVQTVAWPAELKARRFEIRLDGGGSTGWGIQELSVITSDPPPRRGFRLHVQ